MELLGLYNDKGEFLNEMIERGSKEIDEGKFIRIVTIWIENEKGEFLIQLAGGNREKEWATTGGHVQLNQTPQSAAILEVKEELGIIIKESDLKYMGFQILKKAIFDVYYLKANIDPSSLILQEEEVSEVKWMDKKQIRQLIKEQKFRNSHLQLFNQFIDKK